MNLYNLKIFADTARLSSMTKSAELNNLSRPAVSQAIKKLEQELGTELLVHKRRLIELTQSGRLLLHRSEELLTAAESIALQIRQNKGPLIRNFRIASSRTLATFNLPAVLEHLNEAFPSVSIQVQMANSSELIRRLERREIDLAFMIGDDYLPGSTQTVVGRGHFVLVKPKSAKDDRVKYAITEKRPETERLHSLFERTHKKPLPIFTEIHSWDAIWHLINEGICGGLIPDFLFTSKPSKGAAGYSVVIPKVFPYEIKAIHLASKSSDPLVQSFLQSIKK